ncbi:hypothetical protein QQF64_036416 [Cirrhinus molitorella]|uniref:Uncharacterized protein n=1 Tax=Cirrhinus molitorella TaxID=172907 RepID=A0ABR3NIH4_9TELE
MPFLKLLDTDPVQAEGYWPYLSKVAEESSDLQLLMEMRPFLSVMHAKCEVRWGGRNQEGAGNTTGEEVEQVNSFLSRAALGTKYMTKAVREREYADSTGHGVEQKKDREPPQSLGSQIHQITSSPHPVPSLSSPFVAVLSFLQGEQEKTFTPPLPMIP